MISKPRYRFFIDEKQISEPIGWNDIKLILERDSEFWSLVESIEQPFEFYGNNAQVDGGYQYLKDIRKNGINVQADFRSEISWDGGITWDTFFLGLLDLTTLREIENKRRFQCTLLRTGPWSKMMNRRSVKVDIVSAGAIPHTTTLPSQPLRKNFRSETYPASDANATLFTYNTTTTNPYGVLELSKKITDELETRYTLVNGVQNVRPAAFFVAKEAGSYSFDIEIYLLEGSTVFGNFASVNVYIQFNDASAIALTKTNIGINGVSGRTRFKYTSTSSLVVGTAIRLYIQDTSGGSTTTFLSPLNPEISYIQIIADTLTSDTTASGFYIHDTARAIVNSNSEDADYFYSEYFGGSLTQAITYANDGCGEFYQLFKGINVRGESLSNYPFTMSFDELWEGIDNIFCLGCGYEYEVFQSGGQTHTKEVLRIEKREFFFDDSVNSVELNGFEMDGNLEIYYDPQFMMTAIQNGYNKWEAETLVGLDDPQTKHNYKTILKTVGTKESKDIKIMSSIYAASVGIEQTRRKTFEPKKDWRLDEDIFIIEVFNGVVSLYSGTTNLLNGSKRYNVRLTPSANFYRWLEWLSIAFQDYIGDYFYFVGGEGNINMTYNPGAAPTNCDIEAGAEARTRKSERDNIRITTSPFLPLIYEFKIPLNWQQWKGIRDNKTRSIGFTYQNNEGDIITAKLFIKQLSYDPNKSQAEFTCWLKSES